MTRDRRIMCDYTEYWYPVLPFWGWTAYTPVIPKLYYDCISQEQSILNLWKCFDKLTHYADYLAENINKYAPVELEERITALEIETGELNESVDKLLFLNEDEKNKYFNKNIIFFGDSYTQGYNLSDVTKRFSTQICDILQATELNFYVNGTGFLYKHADLSAQNFNERITYASTALTEEQKTNTALVIIAGGINDAQGVYTYTYDDEYTAVKNTLINARTVFSTAKILVVPMLWKGFQFTSKARELYTAIVNAVLDSNIPGVYTMEGCYTWCFGDSTKYNVDKLHPNEAGSTVMANRILSGIFGQLDSWEDQILHPTWVEGIEIAPNGSFQTLDTSNDIRIVRGMVYAGPYRIVCADGNNSNITAGYLPKSCTPENTVAGLAMGGSTILGTFYLTYDNLIGLSCYLSAAAANQRFNCSSLVYPLYGKDYNA